MKFIVYVDADMSYAAVDEAFEAADHFSKNNDGRVLLVDLDGAKSLINLVSYKIDSNKTLLNPSLDNSGLLNYTSKKVFRNLEMYITGGVKIGWNAYDLESTLCANIGRWRTEFECVIVYIPFNYIYYEKFWKLLRKEATEMFQVVSEGNKSRIISNLSEIVRPM
jgi:hypothetical protein